MLSQDSAPVAIHGMEVNLIAPAILRLEIQRFRGIESLLWLPARGVNIILGGGDVGKTTILDAITLLLSPTNTMALSDTDYYDRNITEGFMIEAVMALPVESGIDYQFKPSWPWEWNGRDAVVPSIEVDGTATGDPVYRLRVRGTEDLDLVYEIVQPDSTADGLSVSLRRAIGLVKLGGDDRNDRDLRLVQGSALDRLLSDKSLRSRLASELAKRDVSSHLLPEKKDTLTSLDEVFKRQNLPHNLDLSIIGGQSASIASMVGLTATRNEVQLPLASWGAGTRRLSTLAISEQNQGEAPVTVVDEIERGLEPYRQRALIEKIQARRSQAFATTHSPFIIEEASKANIWYIDSTGRIGPLDGTKISKVRSSDPGMFLSRLAIIAEGATEVGFVSALLERALPLPLKACGIYVCNCGGNERALDVLEALTEGGLRFAGFADDEKRYPTRWQKLAEALGPLLFRWRLGCTEENLIGVTPDDKLEAMLVDPEDEKTGRRKRSLMLRLNLQEKEGLSSTPLSEFRSVMTAAALGAVPPDKVADKSVKKEYEKHSQDWFKTVAGGRELEAKLFSLGLWPALKEQLLPFCNAVCKELAFPEVSDLKP